MSNIKKINRATTMKQLLSYFRELETENANLQEEYQVLKASSSSSTTTTTGSSAPHSTGSSTGLTSSRYDLNNWSKSSRIDSIFYWL